MTIAAGPFAIAALLLGIGGLLKVTRPIDTANALRATGIAVPEWVVRTGAAAEVGIGTYALAVGDRYSAVLVALSYVLFTAFVAVAMAKGAPIASCGCFGRVDTPPSHVHIALNILFTAAASMVAIDPDASLARAIDEQPLAGVPFVMLVTTGVFLAFLVMSYLPRTLALVSSGAER